MSRVFWLWVKTQGHFQGYFSFLSPFSKQIVGNFDLTILCSHLYLPCLLPAPHPALPRKRHPVIKTHGSCTGLRRIQVYIDRGPASHTPHPSCRHQAPHRWLKNTPPGLERTGGQTSKGHPWPSHPLLGFHSLQSHPLCWRAVMCHGVDTASRDQDGR